MESLDLGALLALLKTLDGKTAVIAAVALFIVQWYVKSGKGSSILDWIKARFAPSAPVAPATPAVPPPKPSPSEADDGLLDMLAKLLRERLRLKASVAGDPVAAVSEFTRVVDTLDADEPPRDAERE